MKGLFFIDYLQSFALGNPDITEAWKHTIFEFENQEFDVIAFKVPKKRASECIENIERLLKNKLT